MARDFCRMGLLLAVLSAAAVPVDATCPGQRQARFESGYLFGGYYNTQLFTIPGQGFDQPPYSSVSADVGGVFWAIGFGDPRIGAGIDNGSYAPFTPQGYYGIGEWIYTGGYPFFLPYSAAFLVGDWNPPSYVDGTTDGCVLDAPSPVACQAVMLSDQVAESGYFALLSAAPTPLPNQTIYSYRREPVAPIDMAPIPPPALVEIAEDAGRTDLVFDLPAVPEAALYLSDACPSDLILGYRLYLRPVGTDEAFDGDRRRALPDGTEVNRWTLARGGAGPEGVALTPGTRVSIQATDCSGGSLLAAVSVVFESGFETQHVSANGPPIPCGDCEGALPDMDGDGFSADPCAPQAQADCDDTDADIFPGAPEVCDGLSNDCLDSAWPSLGGVDDADFDNDGISNCFGEDPCPFDAQNDSDADGLCADVDICPEVFDPRQADRDGDGSGDACDPCPDDSLNDFEQDGVCADLDNCPESINPDQVDLDGDGQGDVCDECFADPDNDIDADGICGNVDVCPLDPFNDRDRDGLCADVDPCPEDPLNDAEGDGLCADIDSCPLDPDPSGLDSDGDGFGDVCDLFFAAEPISPVLSTGRVDAVDLDDDDDVDLLVAEAGDLVWYENLGDGRRWQRHLAVPSVAHVGVIDVDGDGRPDALVRGGAFPGVDLISYRNVGSAGPWPMQAIVSTGVALERLVRVDLNGDELEDLAGYSSQDRSISWFENPGNGSSLWARETIVDGLVSFDDFDVADIDGDGMTDIVATSIGVLAGYLNPNGGEWLQRIIAEGNFIEVAAGDLDRDGDADVVSRRRPSGAPSELVMHRSAADGTEWRQEVVDFAGRDYEGLRVADLDGDGWHDLVWEQNSFGGLRWLLNPADSGGPWKRRGVSVVSGSFDVADLNGDQALDIVVSYGFAALALEWYENAADLAPLRVDSEIVPLRLWPPNRRWVDIEANVSALGGCAPRSIVLESVVSDEPADIAGASDGRTSVDIRDANLETLDAQFQLRAERDREGDGRTYQLVYRATDCAGRVARSSQAIEVPLAIDGAVEPLQIEVTFDRSLRTTVLTWPEVPDALHYSAIRGKLPRLRETAGAFELGATICLADRATTTRVADDLDPSPGDAWFYLVGYTDPFGFSGYGTESAELPRVAQPAGCLDQGR